MKTDDLDIVFQALAHCDRRRILDLVRSTPGCRVDELSRHFATSRIAILKHLRVLEQAELIHSEKVGRTRLLYFNVVPIQMIHERWTTELSAHWASYVTDIKQRVEAGALSALNPPATKRKRHA
jgi:DNA-binding transcriptional ArsR family regulator